MRKVTVNLLIDAPPGQVFAAIANPQKPFLTSNPFTRLSVVGTQTSGEGTVYRWTFALPLGVRFKFDEVVTEWIEPKRFSYCAISGWTMYATNQLTPENKQTRVKFSLDYKLAGIWCWLIPSWLVRLGIHQSLKNLKRMVEEQHGIT